MRAQKHRIAILTFALIVLFHPQSIIAFHQQSAQKVLTLTVVNSEELAARVFVREQQTIALFAKHKPIVETYIQSLNPDLQPEGIIDDAYFLARVSLDPDSFKHPEVQTLAFGRSDKSRRIRMNHGGRWPVYPDGYVSMQFVGISTFDRAHYALKYDGQEQLGNTACLRLRVTPLSTNPGQFEGNIWVEAADLHIVRIQGTFTPGKLGTFEKYLNVGGISTVGFFFHFDSWRQEVSPGIWLPSHTYFDEERLWTPKGFTTSMHFRGNIWVWGYSTGELSETPNTSPGHGGPYTQLEAEGLLATPGAVEHSVDAILDELRTSNHLSLPVLRCRVLMTTPVEIFSSGNTVLLSRGLLNMVPDKAILATLLAREVAYITLGLSGRNKASPGPVFDARRASDFPGFGPEHTREEAAAASRKTLELLQNTPYASAVPSANEFISMFRFHSPHMPHLARPNFGLGLLDRGPFQPVSEVAHNAPLWLKADYGIDSWLNQITLLHPIEAVSPGE